MATFLRAKETGSHSLNFEFLDGDMAKVAFADPYPEMFNVPSQRHTPRSIYGGGAPVSPEHIPTRLSVSGKKTQLVDFNSTYRLFLVSRRFIAVVERFQTEIQCFPVECTWKDGTPAGDYSFFFTPVCVDAVVREQTTVPWFQMLPDRGFWRPAFQKGQTFTFDTSRLGGRHLWVDPNMPDMGTLVSDALYSALQEAKIESFYESNGFAEI